MAVTVWVSTDGRWRIEGNGRTIRVYQVGQRGRLLLRAEVWSPPELDVWLRTHAGIGLVDLRQRG